MERIFKFIYAASIVTGGTCSPAQPNRGWIWRIIVRVSRKCLVAWEVTVRALLNSYGGTHRAHPRCLLLGFQVVACCSGVPASLRFGEGGSLQAHHNMATHALALDVFGNYCTPGISACFSRRRVEVSRVLLSRWVP